MEKKIIYQVLPRLWGKGKFSDWDRRAFDYLKGLGVDYLWLTGIPRHASGKDFVKGDPGCPYAICDWYDTNPYLAEREDERLVEFESLVRRAHLNGIKIIIDFIPNHTSKDYSGDIPLHNWHDGDWSDTLKIDYSSPDTVPSMTDLLEFWAKKGVDGFRCDMVELVPRESLAQIIRNARLEYPHLLFIAEVYDRNNYRSYINDVGFDLLYDKSGIYDELRGIITTGHTAESITWNWQYLGEIQSNMLNFLENHDEQRIASSSYAGDVSRTWASLAVALLFNKASFMLYFAQEVGENASESGDGRTSIFNICRCKGAEQITKYIYEDSSLKGKTGKTLKRYRELMQLATTDTFRNGENWDLCYCNGKEQGFDRTKHFAFARFDCKSAFITVCNFSPAKASMQINIPDGLKESFGLNLIEVSVEPYDYRILKIR